MDNPTTSQAARVMTLAQAAKDCGLKPDELLTRAANGDVDLSIRIPPTLYAHIVVRNFVNERPGQSSGAGALFPQLVMPIPYPVAREVVLTRKHCGDILAYGQCDAWFFPAVLEYTEGRDVEFRRLLDRKIIPGWRERLAGRGYNENRSLSAWPDFGGDPPFLVACEHDELSYLVSKEGLLHPAPENILEERLRVCAGDTPYPTLLPGDMDRKLRAAEQVLLDEQSRQAPYAFEYWFALYPTDNVPGINRAREVECPSAITIDPSALRISEDALARIIPGRTIEKPDFSHALTEFDLETHENTSTSLKALNDIAIKIWSATSPYDDTFPTEEALIKTIMAACNFKEYLAKSAELVIRPDYAKPKLPPQSRARLGKGFRSERWKRVVEASRKYWANADPTDPAQCTHNDIVEDWLVGKPKEYMPADVAKHMAGLIRPDNAKRSRPK